MQDGGPPPGLDVQTNKQWGVRPGSFHQPCKDKPFPPLLLGSPVSSYEMVPSAHSV